MPVVRGHPIVHRVLTRRAQGAHADAGDRPANLRVARRPQVAVRSNHCHRGERRLQILAERRADPVWSGAQSCVGGRISSGKNGVRGGRGSTGDRDGGSHPRHGQYSDKCCHAYSTPRRAKRSASMPSSCSPIEVWAVRRLGPGMFSAALTAADNAVSRSVTAATN